MVSSAKGSRSFSAAALSESPANNLTSHDHTSEAVNVCRGKMSARKKANVRPHPPRSPRLEQYTRCPRNVSPSVALGSFPNARLCRFKLPMQPQCGHGDCLREKAAPSTPGRRAQNEKADGTSPLLPKVNQSRRAFSARHLKTAELGSERFEKKKDGADGTSSTLPS